MWRTNFLFAHDLSGVHKSRQAIRNCGAGLLFRLNAMRTCWMPFLVSKFDLFSFAHLVFSKIDALGDWAAWNQSILLLFFFR